jgi:exodeoxyribonuclease VII small subunit
MSTRAKPPRDEVGYDAAMAELEAILAAIEREAMPIDELAPNVERATWLIQRCRHLLTATETRVVEALKALEAPEPADDDRA